MSVPSTAQMASLIVKLKLDFGKLSYTMPTSRRQGLRKRSAPVGQSKSAPSAKRRKSEKNIEEATMYTASSDNMDTDAESLTTAKTTKRAKSTKRAERVKRSKCAKVNKTPYYENATMDKPEPHGQPSVWAHKRQQLCETLPQYNAYQSGAYYSSGKLHGFLVDKEVGRLDKFDDQIIITTIGGDRKKDKDGNTIQTASKDNKAAAKSAQRTMDRGDPVLLIVGQGNRLTPCKLSHYYNVLGWFKVTDIWRETETKVWKIRFEKIDLTERSWWAARGTYPDGTAPLSVNYDYPKATVQTCAACNSPSKHIYEQGWVCLQTSCREFFRFADEAIDVNQLEYSNAFLKERRVYTGPQTPPLAPALPTQADLDASTTPFDFVFKTGIVCPDCGCCSRRVQWLQWACENPGCTFEYRLNTRPVSVADAVAQRRILRPDYHHASITARQFPAGNYTVHEYVLPGPGKNIAGWVRLFKATPQINGEADGPDDLFTQTQCDDFKLTRNPSKNKGGISEVLTSHFASNWGAVYKYGVTPSTHGFSEAPPVILKALKRLTWAGKHAVENDMQPFYEFNELLLLGYFEGGAIGYHDDGESTLGPTVATLSLGGDAMMHFRPKATSDIGAPGKGKKGLKPDYLKIKLNHGDLLVMHGTDIHKNYEHAVKPSGKLRFALTSRFIIPEKMETEADTEFARIGGTLPEGHEKYDYNGILGTHRPIALPFVQTAAQPVIQPVAQPIVEPTIQPAAQPDVQDDHDMDAEEHDDEDNLDAQSVLQEEDANDGDHVDDNHFGTQPINQVEYENFFGTQIVEQSDQETSNAQFEDVSYFGTQIVEQVGHESYLASQLVEQVDHKTIGVQVDASYFDTQIVDQLEHDTAVDRHLPDITTDQVMEDTLI